jgi:hypothetical protein
VVDIGSGVDQNILLYVTEAASEQDRGYYYGACCLFIYQRISEISGVYERWIRRNGRWHVLRSYTLLLRLNRDGSVARQPAGSTRLASLLRAQNGPGLESSS